MDSVGMELMGFAALYPSYELRAYVSRRGTVEGVGNYDGLLRSQDMGVAELWPLGCGRSPDETQCNAEPDSPDYAVPHRGIYYLSEQSGRVTGCLSPRA
jgi:hypothetical protein